MEEKIFICYLQETHFRCKDTCRLNVKRWKKISHGKGNQKKGGIAILLSDKIEFKTETVVRNKERDYIKGSIQQKDITFVNIYVPNRGAPKYVKQMLKDLREK